MSKIGADTGFANHPQFARRRFAYRLTEINDSRPSLPEATLIPADRRRVHEADPAMSASVAVPAVGNAKVNGRKGAIADFRSRPVAGG